MAKVMRAIIVGEALAAQRLRSRWLARALK